MGQTILGALFGRKAVSVGNASRAGSAARGMGRASKEKEDIERATKDAKARREELVELEAGFRTDIEALKERTALEGYEVEAVPVRPRKADIAIQPITLAWAPWTLDETGMATRAFES